MRRTVLLATGAATLAAAASGLGACGDDETAQSAVAAPDPPAATGPADERPTGATLTVRRTRYGTILADGRGRILYEFTRDGTANRSRCYGDCAVAWPPFYTRGQPRVRGVARKHLGTTRRRDGRLQVTYRGKPLYYYVTDTRPGQVTCQAVPEFGGTWYVTNPDGRTNRSPR
jgi:predicted lipoprotein with Yx(FWY)xxD motif